MALLKKLLSTQRARYIAGAVVLGIIWLTYLGVDSTTMPVETYEVQSGEFIVSVVTAGDLIARESRVVTAPSDIRGELQIVEIVPEGARVEAGDFLIRFDTAELENRLIEEESQLEEYRLQREETVAKQTAAMVQQEAALQVQRYTHEQAKIQYELMKFEPEIKQRQQEIDMKKADLQLFEAEENIKRLRLQHQQELNRIDERIRRQKEDVREVQEQIEASTLYAPIGGLVVYKENYISGTKQKIKVGQSVHRRMQLIELPDLSVMKVQTAVNEVDISKVRREQEVVIDMDANDNTYYGRVTEIARLARNEGGAGNVKVFDVEVTIENSDEALKPGMSATCQIITDRIDSAVFIPIQSVFEEEGKTFVYMGDGYDKRFITTGQRNTDFVVMEEGLRPGEKVTLRDPYSRLEVIGRDIKEKPKTASGSAARNAQTESAFQDFRGRGMMIRR